MTWRHKLDMIAVLFSATICLFLPMINTGDAFTSNVGACHQMRVIQQRICRTRFLTMAKSDEMTDEERKIAMDKATKSMTAFTNKYLENTETFLCSDSSVPAVVIKGLAEHKVNLGAPLCPCRFYDDKESEVKDGYWNCPCVPMRERQECHCMLFLTKDNTFAGESQHITVDEVKTKTEGFETN
mmetsp:Transcript_10458/g.18979  ORF Transcript_10458/g.18979 Transcript_10458/m.18979 type:complete len:184 (+) Transcript_10458:85-636(+)